MFAALPGHPAFIPIAKARGPQPGVLLGGKRSIGERRDKALDAVHVPPVVFHNEYLSMRLLAIEIELMIAQAKTPAL